MDSEKILLETFGEENLESFKSQTDLLKIQENELNEINNLKDEASSLFKVQLTKPELALAVSAGILLGLANNLFKNYIHIKSIDKNGKIKWDNGFGGKTHKHGVTRTVIDHKVPNPKGGAKPDLHRQIGPTHDVIRFKETIELITGEKDDYKLWGSTAKKILGHDLRPIGSSGLNNFRIPPDPKKELMNHLLIDFFTKRSLPLPGSTYIADHSEKMARVMLGMYDEGLNFKNTVGNFIGYTMVNLILNAYTYLFKGMELSNFSLKNVNRDSLNNLYNTYKELKKQNEYYFMMIISHSSSFIVDSAVTFGTKNYSGLLQLNYISLLAAAKNVLSYIIKNSKKYNELLEEIKAKQLYIQDIDNSWGKGFQDNFNEKIQDPNFISLFSIEEWKQRDNKIMELEESLEELDKSYSELEEIFGG